MTIDSGLAALLGAFIALVGGVATPWLRDRWERSSRAEELRRQEIRKLLVEMTREITALKLSRRNGNEATTQLHRTRAIEWGFELRLILNESEEPIYEMLSDVHDAADDETLDGTDAWRRRWVLASVLLPMWYRGELSPKDTLAQYFKRRPAVASHGQDDEDDS